jgi:glycosyltransferase involved in cell wall biosynthesis
VHPLAHRQDIPIAHVTRFNEVMWDNGVAPTAVVEHGVVDPGHLYRGDRASLAVVVNEPVRRWRVAGTDLVERLAGQVPVDVYGMGMAALEERVPAVRGRTHENLRQSDLHPEIGRHRAYLHPYRWTSLGLSLIEAMTIGMPVLALAVTAAPESVPPEAGLVTNDLSSVVRTARRWMTDPGEAEQTGRRARDYALSRFGLSRSLSDWDALLKEVLR